MNRSDRPPLGHMYLSFIPLNSFSFSVFSPSLLGILYLYKSRVSNFLEHADDSKGSDNNYNNHNTTHNFLSQNKKEELQFLWCNVSKSVWSIWIQLWQALLGILIASLTIQQSNFRWKDRYCSFSSESILDKPEDFNNRKDGLLHEDI